METQNESNSRDLKEFGRGIIGGLLFSLPIIYTMEVWWTGFLVSPEKLIGYVIVTFLLLLGYNKFAGMRKDSSFLEICRDSVEEVGLAFMVTFLLLWLLGRIDMNMSIYETTGKVIVESMIMAIGISVGTSQLGQNGQETGMTNDNKDDHSPKTRNDYLSLIILSICGAILVASSVAPTEEIVVIGLGSSLFQLILMVVFSLLLSTVTLYFSDFKGAIKNTVDFEIMMIHIMLSYMVAFGVSVAMLWFFGRFDTMGFYACLAQTIVLSIPAIIGASAGRLLITYQRGKRN